MAEQRSSPPLRVLVVDDVPDARASLSMLLTLWGHEPREAADGPAALRVAADFRPDVALVDLGLPGMSGLKLAPRLRELPGLERCRLAAVSGAGLPEDLVRCRAAGFERHFLKPLNLAALQTYLGDAAVARPG